MTDLPVYVWLLILIAAVGMPIATAFVLKGRAGLIVGVLWPVWVAVTALLSPPIPIAVAVGLIAALPIMWLARTTPQRLARLQTFRVVGGVFLIAMALGELPPAFALPAGLGDIAVGIAAPFVARRAALLWFNVLGILDLVVALAVGVLLLPSTLAITELPLIVIPATVVPLALALHVLALRRSLA